MLFFKLCAIRYGFRISKELAFDWVGGVQKGQNLDYVIFEWSLIGTEKARLEKLKAEKAKG